MKRANISLSQTLITEIERKKEEKNEFAMQFIDIIERLVFCLDVVVFILPVLCYLFIENEHYIWRFEIKSKTRKNTFRDILPIE